MTDYEPITREEYVRRDKAGLITRPLTDFPMRRGRNRDALLSQHATAKLSPIDRYIAAQDRDQ